MMIMPAFITSGNNINITANTHNRYSFISASRDIKFDGSLTNDASIKAYTKVHTNDYVEHCDGNKYRGGCSWYHKYNKVSDAQTLTASVHSTIQAGGSITGNLDNLNNGNIKQGVAVSTTPEQTANTDTTANTNTNTNTQINSVQTERVNNIHKNTNKQQEEIITTTQILTNTEVSHQASNPQTKKITTKAIKPNAITTPSQETTTAPTNTLDSIQLPELVIDVPKDDYGLFVKTKEPTANYLIETNPEFTIYENFISSDYLLKRLDFNPETLTKRLGDALYEQKLVKEQLFAQTGRRFLQKDITSDNAQYQKLMVNALAQQTDLELVAGISLSSQQIASLTKDIVWFETQIIAGERVLVPKLYIKDPASYQIVGSQIIAGKGIDLEIDKLVNTGLIEAGDYAFIDATDDILNQGGTIKADGTLSLLAQNDINNISGTIKAHDINLISNAGNIINSRYQQAVDYSTTTSKDTKKLIGAQANIIANNNLNLNANQGIRISGSTLRGKGITLNANILDIITTIQQTDFFGGDSKNYIKEQTTTHLISDISADNLNINAHQQVIIKGSNLQADQQLNIITKIFDIASVKDSSFKESHSESSGGLFGGKSKSTTTHQTQTNIQSTLDTKQVNLNTQITQLTASKIQAEAIEITAKLLNLVSDKDLDFKQVKSDKSGMLTRKIKDKGHNLETTVSAELIGKLTLNNH